ncbi:response regulator transcription factor [Pseudonocardia kongjuensis]|uniref:Response regulator transcription factor n=1 Tax=Pseudonocardia kongjuensis TaxID=102227 RepID=A0ABN1XZP9_9PSEU
MSAPIRVLLVDDHELIRSGLAGMLGARDGIEVVGEAADGAAGLAEAARLIPDVVLMDVRMPVLDGIEATRRLRSAPGRAPRVLVLTTFDLDEYVYRALRAGADGFLLKDAPPDRIAEAVRTVAAGEALLAPAPTRRLIERFVARTGAVDAARERLAALTDRETEVLRLVARGRSNAEVGLALFVSEATVKTHLTRVFGKLGLRDRVQAVVFAYESGLVEPGGTVG